METDATQRKDPTLVRLSSEEENYGVIAAPPPTPIDSNLPTFVELNENDLQAEQEQPAELFVDVESEIPSQKKSDPENDSKGLIQTFPPPKPPAPQNLMNVEDRQEEDSNSEETKSPIRNLAQESTTRKNRKSLPPPRPPPPNTQKITEKNRRSLPPPRPPAPRLLDDLFNANPQNQKETSRISEENSNEPVDTVDGNICSKPLKTIDDQENVQDHLEVDRKSQDDVTIEYVELDFTSSNQDEEKASLDKSIEHQVVDLPADIKVKKVIDLDEMIKTKVDSPRLPPREAKNQESRQIVSQVSTLERLPSIDENAEVHVVEDNHTTSEPISKWKPSLPPTKPKRLEENLENPELEEIQKEDQPVEKETNIDVEPEIELDPEPIKKEKPPLPTLSSKPQHVDEETKDEIESSSELPSSSPKPPRLPVNPRQEAKKQEEAIQLLNQADEQITPAESPKVEQKKVASESVSTPSPKSKSKAKNKLLQETIQTPKGTPKGTPTGTPKGTPKMQRKLKQQGIHPSPFYTSFFLSLFIDKTY